MTVLPAICFFCVANTIVGCYGAAQKEFQKAQELTYSRESISLSVTHDNQGVLCGQGIFFAPKSLYEQGLQTSIDISESTFNNRLPLLSLQQPIETAVKYDLATPATPLKIDLLEKGSLFFLNNLSPQTIEGRKQ